MFISAMYGYMKWHSDYRCDIIALIRQYLTISLNSGIYDRFRRSAPQNGYVLNLPNKTEFYHMKIVIAGAGGHGRVLLDILRNNHQFEVAAFLDADPALHGKNIDGLEVIGGLDTLEKFRSLGIGGGIIAIGDNRIRQVYADRFEKNHISLVSAIHPSATMADTASVGKNVTIAAGANICTHVAIEDSAIVNTGAIIDHESHIQKAAHICPGVRIAGHVIVRPYAFVGIGATIIQGISIGESAIVGAGAVVLEDVPPYATVVGVPARIIAAQKTPDNKSYSEQNAVTILREQHKQNNVAISQNQ